MTTIIQTVFFKYAIRIHGTQFIIFKLSWAALFSFVRIYILWFSLFLEDFPKNGEISYSLWTVQFNLLI